MFFSLAQFNDNIGELKNLFGLSKCYFVTFNASTSNMKN